MTLKVDLHNLRGHKLRAHPAGLNGLPRLGRVVPEVGDENVREILLYVYRILYEVAGDDIFILAVVHKRRDLLAEQIGK